MRVIDIERTCGQGSLDRNDSQQRGCATIGLPQSRKIFHCQFERELEVDGCEFAKPRKSTVTSDEQAWTVRLDFPGTIRLHFSVYTFSLDNPKRILRRSDRAIRTHRAWARPGPAVMHTAITVPGHSANSQGCDCTKL